MRLKPFPRAEARSRAALCAHPGRELTQRAAELLPARWRADRVRRSARTGESGDMLRLSLVRLSLVRLSLVRSPLARSPLARSPVHPINLRRATRQLPQRSKHPVQDPLTRLLTRRLATCHVQDLLA